MAEMLLQSHAGDIDVLPALPQAWPTGRVTGLRARGGFDIDIEWRDRRLVSVTLRSTWGTSATLRHGNATRAVMVPVGGSITWDGR